MRSGLQNPGAIPLLAVLIAALLSVPPMLCEALVKAEDAPGIDNPGTSSGIYHHMDFVPRICEHVNPSSDPSIISTFSTIDTLWQQVCQIATAFILSSSASSKQQDIHIIHKLDDTIEQILSPPPPDQHPLEPLHNTYSNNHNNLNINKSNSIDSHPAISLAFFADKSSSSYSSLSSSSSSPSTTATASSPQHPSSENAVVNASSPVDRKGSYMAILISLVVAIMWF